MSGKARPSLRAKTLLNVDYSNLSITDKNCIHEVFDRFENMAEVVRCKDCKWYQMLHSGVKPYMQCCNLAGLCRKCKPADFCSYGERKDGAE